MQQMRPLLIHLENSGEYDIYVEDINGELEECYEMMYKEPVRKVI